MVTAAERWASATLAQADHPYLVAHGMSPEGLRQDGDMLLVAAKDVETREVVGILRIGPDGRAYTEGRVAGAMASIGASASKRKIRVCAAWADGVRVHEETGDPVAVAFEDSNVDTVAQAMLRRYPAAQIIVSTRTLELRDHRSAKTMAGDASGGRTATTEPSSGCGDPWPDHPRLPGPKDPERLPLDALPPVFAAHVRSVASALQVPPELPELLALACVSAAVAGKVELEPRVGWRESSGIYTAVILPPGSRKSPTFEALTRPLRDREAVSIELARSAYQAALAAVDVARAKLDAAKKAAAKKNGESTDVVAARQRLAAAEACIPPDGRLLVGDVTPEALVQRLAVQGGRAAVLEPEPGPLQVIAGRYSENARLGEINKAWSGEDIIVDRVGRGPLHVRRPALTVAVLLQPDVLENLPNGRALRAEGTVGRVLWCLPPHGLGSRLTGAAVPPLDEAAREKYNLAIRELLDMEPPSGGADGTRSVHVLRPDADALEVLHAFEAEVEEQLADGGRYASIRDWAGKMVGQALRVSVLLELAARAAERRPLAAPIGFSAMSNAVRLVRALASHALVVLDGLDADPRTEALRYLAKRLQELPAGTTESELRDSARRHRYIEDAEDLADLLDELERRGCLRRIQQARTGPGRPPSPVLQLHPRLRQGPTADCPGNPENRRVESTGAHSRDFREEIPGSPAGVDGPPPNLSARSGPDPVIDVLEARG